MATILLVIIYISFISLGLPDSLLGSAWPIIHRDLSVSLSSAGIISMTITGGTIVSSFLSSSIIRRFGTGKVTAVSVLMTAMALFGFFMGHSFYWLCVMAVPLGLGAGAVDSALNNFVALNFKAKHMSWLHCFWGVGATAGPIIMSLFLADVGGWRKGYLTISIIQFILVIALFVSLPIWSKFQVPKDQEEQSTETAQTSKLLRIKGVKAALLAFFCYCAVEMTAGLWGSTYLVQYKGISADKAAQWISLYYLGITLGRLVSGFLTMKLNNKALIKIGQVISFIGALLLIVLPTGYQLLGFMLLGFGCAPIYPSMLHETPRRFGREVSQSMMGIQMACAYIGSTVMPPVFGVLAEKIGPYLLPYFLIILIVMMIISSELINRISESNALE